VENLQQGQIVLGLGQVEIIEFLVGLLLAAVLSLHYYTTAVKAPIVFSAVCLSMSVHAKLIRLLMRNCL